MDLYDFMFGEEDVGDNPELRRRIETDDPSLVKLSIMTWIMQKYEDQTYMPSSAERGKQMGLLWEGTHTSNHSGLKFLILLRRTRFVPLVLGLPTIHQSKICTLDIRDLEQTSFIF